jgi:hypothetical protein
MSELEKEFDKAMLNVESDDDAAISAFVDDLRKRCKYNLDPGAQITCWNEYESLRAEYDALKAKVKGSQIMNVPYGGRDMKVCYCVPVEEVPDAE